MNQQIPIGGLLREARRGSSTRRVLALLCWLLLIFILGGTAHCGAETTQQDSAIRGDMPPELVFKRVVLPNGIQVVVHHTPQSGLGCFECLFNVGRGSRFVQHHEVFHLIEHLFFFTPGPDARTYFNILNEAFGSGLEYDGLTGWTFTRYESRVLAENLAWVIALEGWRFSQLSKLFPVRVETEKRILEAERWESRQKNDVFREFLDLFNRFSRTADPGFDLESFGSPFEVSLPEMNDILQQAYTGPNLTIAVAGPVEPDSMISWVASAFAGFPGTGTISPLATSTATPGGTVISTAGVNLPVPGIEPMRLFAPRLAGRLMIGWPAPERFSPNYPAFRLFYAIFCGKRSTSRFHKDPRLQELTPDRGWADPREDSWPFLFVTKLASEAYAAECLRRYHARIANLIASGPTPAEMREAREDWKKDFWEAYGTPEGRIRLLALGNLHRGDPGAWRTEWERMESLTASDVVAFARSALVPEKAICVICTASAPGIIATEAQGASSSVGGLALATATCPLAPAFTAASSAVMISPAIQCHSLTSGLQVWVMEAPYLPKVRAQLVFRGGTGGDLPGREGTAFVTIACLAASFTQPVAGSSDEWKAWDELSFIAWEASPASFARTLDGLLALMASPSFQPASLAAVKQKLRHHEEKSLSKLFRLSLFGPSHRHATRSQGTASSVARILPADLEDFWSRTLQPQRAGLFLQIPQGFRSDIPGLLERAGRWCGNGRLASESRELPRPLDAGSVIYEEVLNASQVRFLQIWPGFAVDDPESGVQRVLLEDLSEHLFLSLRDAGLLYSLTTVPFQWEMIACRFMVGKVPPERIKDVLRHLQTAMRSYFQKTDRLAFLLRKAGSETAFSLRSQLERSEEALLPLISAWGKGLSLEALFGRRRHFDGDLLKRVYPDPEKPFPCFYILSGRPEVIREAASVLPTGPRFLATHTPDLVLRPLTEEKEK